MRERPSLALVAFLIGSGLVLSFLVSGVWNQGMYPRTEPPYPVRFPWPPKIPGFGSSRGTPQPAGRPLATAQAPVLSTSVPRMGPSPGVKVLVLSSPSPRANPTPNPAARSVPAAPLVMLHIVQADVLPERAQANRLAAALGRAGFHPYLVRVQGGFAVRLGAFRRSQSAVEVARLARSRGFPVEILRQAMKLELEER